MQKVREKAMLLQDMHPSSVKRKKVQYPAGLQSTSKPGRKKRINNAGEDLLILKGMVHVVIVKQN